MQNAKYDYRTKAFGRINSTKVQAQPLAKKTVGQIKKETLKGLFKRAERSRIHFTPSLDPSSPGRRRCPPGRSSSIPLEDGVEPEATRGGKLNLPPFRKGNRGGFFLPLDGGGRVGVIRSQRYLLNTCSFIRAVQVRFMKGKATGAASACPACNLPTFFIRPSSLLCLTLNELNSQ